MSRHVGFAVLARYQEGELNRLRTGRVRAHLSRCARCARTEAELADVSAVLAGMPTVRMPDHVAVRLDLAISTEAALRAETAAAADGGAESEPAGSASPAQPLGRPDSRGHATRPRRLGRTSGRPSGLVLRGLAIAGSIAVIALTGFVLTRSPQGGTSASAGASHAGSLGGQAARPPIRLGYSMAGTTVTAPVIASTANLTRASLASEVARQVTRTANAAARNNTGLVTGSSGSEPQATQGTIGGISTSQLSGCVTRVSRGNVVLLVEVARYQGAPAVIIVTRPLPAGGELKVFVVAAACSASRTDVVATATVPAG